MSPSPRKAHNQESEERSSAANMEFLFVSLCFFLLVQSVLSQNALTPPRGWNSYTAYSWTISERQFIDNVNELSRRLLDHGYEYAVLDINWFRNRESQIDSIDEWGRVIPDPERWPSSLNGRGLTVVADTVHELGLKFGIQVIGGINKRAVDQGTPVLDVATGQQYQENGPVTATQIAKPDQACSYAPNFMAVDVTSGGGKAFLRSIYEQYAAWGVDFVKLDCVFGDHLNMGEIGTVSEILKGLKRTMIFSVSPGVAATTEMGRQASQMVNMYRVTPNNWDEWQILARYFDVARDFAHSMLLGSAGLNGNSWPDLDILPFGWLGEPNSMDGPHRQSRLTIPEQTTEMTLWCMAKSPLMFGGDMKKLDFKTQLLLTNPTLLAINSDSSNNMEITNPLGPGIRTWLATGKKGEIYVAIFNLNKAEVKTKMDIILVTEKLPMKGNFNNCTGSDLWNEANEVANGSIVANVGAHACSLFTLTCS